jgi:hypothetical protein
VPDTKPAQNEKPEAQEAKTEVPVAKPDAVHPAPESGGRGGLEPTRYGDWEVGGICTDF